MLLDRPDGLKNIQKNVFYLNVLQKDTRDTLNSFKTNAKSKSDVRKMVNEKCTKNLLNTGTNSLEPKIACKLQDAGIFMLCALR